jgi:hypothetical protein
LVVVEGVVAAVDSVFWLLQLQLHSFSLLAELLLLVEGVVAAVDSVFWLLQVDVWLVDVVCFAALDWLFCHAYAAIDPVSDGATTPIA